MTVTGQGQTQNVTRPGSQVIVNTGASPSPPSLLPHPAASRLSLVSSRAAAAARPPAAVPAAPLDRAGRAQGQRRQRRLEGAEFRPFRQQLRRRQFGAAGELAGHWRWPAQHQQQRDHEHHQPERRRRQPARQYDASVRAANDCDHADADRLHQRPDRGPKRRRLHDAGTCRRLQRPQRPFANDHGCRHD